MDDHRHIRTDRLRLDTVDPADLDEHRALLGDPGVWRHLPGGRHVRREQTEATMVAGVEQWRRAGLGYWTARLRDDLPGTPLVAGQMVGTGGCTVRAGTDWWNLYYRLTPAAWGHGLAAELVDAALAAAGRTDPELPVVA